MKNFHTILSGFLALFVLMSSISHSVSFHFCGGQIQSMAIFGKAQECMEHDRGCDHSGNSKHTTLSHESCCQDATLSVESDKYAFTEKVIVEISHLVSLLPGTPIHQVNPYSDVTSVHFSDYRPPLIERDITILVQSFLI